MAHVHDDDDESDLDDREFPDEHDADADADADAEGASATSTEPCPFCHKPVYADADICPHCRNFVAIDDLPPSHPWWYWAGLIGAFLVAATWALFG